MEDFIGQYNNVLSKQECDFIIQYFENMKQLNMSFARTNGTRHIFEDETVFVTEPEEFSLDHTQSALKPFMDRFGSIYENYANRYSVLAEGTSKYGILNMRLQKTPPGGGYHAWHYETSSIIYSPRFMTFMIYLNDVQEGGETEFLYLQKRIKPEAGKVLIWPSGFTHTHRGNPPLGENKYILTGWLNYLE